MTSTLIATSTDEPMTHEQLRAATKKLGMLSREGLRDAYRHAHDECRLEPGTLPKAGALQELVLAWRLMRAWYDRCPAEEEDVP